MQRQQDHFLPGGVFRVQEGGGGGVRGGGVLNLFIKIMGAECQQWFLSRDRWVEGGREGWMAALSCSHSLWEAWQPFSKACAATCRLFCATAFPPTWVGTLHLQRLLLSMLMLIWGVCAHMHYVDFGDALPSLQWRSHFPESKKCFEPAVVQRHILIWMNKLFLSF